MMPRNDKRKASAETTNEPSSKRQRQTKKKPVDSPARPLIEEQLNQESESIPEPVDSQSSGVSEYAARGILAERATTYLIDWEDDPVTGKSYEPSWQPKRCANAPLVKEWEDIRKAKALEKVNAKKQRRTLPQAAQSRKGKEKESSPGDEESLTAPIQTPAPRKLRNRRIIDSSAASIRAQDRTKETTLAAHNSETVSTTASPSIASLSSLPTADELETLLDDSRLPTVVISAHASFDRDAYKQISSSQIDPTPPQQTSSLHQSITQSTQSNDSVTGLRNQPVLRLLKRVIPDSQDLTDVSLSTTHHSSDKTGITSSAPEVIREEAEEESPPDIPEYKEAFREEISDLPLSSAVAVKDTTELSTNSKKTSAGPEAEEHVQAQEAVDLVSFPVERESTPVERESTLVERESIPVERESIPVERESTPVERESTLVERVSTPVGGALEETSRPTSPKAGEVFRAGIPNLPPYSIVVSKDTIKHSTNPDNTTAGLDAEEYVQVQDLVSRVSIAVEEVSTPIEGAPSHPETSEVGEVFRQPSIVVAEDTLEPNTDPRNTNDEPEAEEHIQAYEIVDLDSIPIEEHVEAYNLGSEIDGISGGITTEIDHTLLVDGPEAEEHSQAQVVVDSILIPAEEYFEAQNLVSTTEGTSGEIVIETEPTLLVDRPEAQEDARAREVIDSVSTLVDGASRESVTKTDHTLLVNGTAESSTEFTSLLDPSLGESQSVVLETVIEDPVETATALEHIEETFEDTDLIDSEVQAVRTTERPLEAKGHGTIDGTVRGNGTESDQPTGSIETRSDSSPEDGVEYPTQQSAEIIEVVQSSNITPALSTLPHEDEVEQIDANIFFTPVQHSTHSALIAEVKSIKTQSESPIRFETQVAFDFSETSDLSPLKAGQRTPEVVPALVLVSEVHSTATSSLVGRISEDQTCDSSGVVEVVNVVERPPFSEHPPIPSVSIESSAGVEPSNEIVVGECKKEQIEKFVTPSRPHSPGTPSEFGSSIALPNSLASRQVEDIKHPEQALSDTVEEFPSELGSPFPLHTISSSLPQPPSQIPDDTLDSLAPPRPVPPSIMSNWPSQLLSPAGSGVMAKKPTFSELRAKYKTEIALEDAQSARKTTVPSLEPESISASQPSTPINKTSFNRMAEGTVNADSPQQLTSEAPTMLQSPEEAARGESDSTEFMLPIQLFGPAGLLYRNNFRMRQNLIDTFLDHGSASQASEVLDKVEQFLQRIFDITTHSDLLSDTSWTQEETSPVEQAKWDVLNSSKFAFLESFFADIRVRSLEKHVVIFARPGKIINSLEIFLKGLGITHERPDRSRRFRGTSSLQVTIVPTGSDQPDQYDTVAVMNPADLVLGLDETFSKTDSAVQQVRRSSMDPSILCPAVIPVAVYTLEHILRVSNPVGTRAGKLRELVSRSSQLMLNAGRPPANLAKPGELGKVLADCFSSILDWERLPSLSSIELPRFEDSQSSNTSQTSSEPLSRKRPATQDSSDENSHVAKKPRWAQDNPANAGESQPFATTSSMISELSAGAHRLLQEALDKERMLREENLRLQEIAASSQMLLDMVKVRNEDQTRELLVLRAQLVTAGDATSAAEARGVTLNNVITEMKAERKMLKEELANARGMLAGSTYPTVAQLEAGRAQGVRADELEKHITGLANDNGFMRSQYQTASNFARELAAEKDTLQAENARLQVQASGEAARLRQMFVDTSLCLAHEELAKLTRKETASGKLIEKLLQENAALKSRPGMTMTTRASSVPRRAGGGGSRAGSRQGSPLPAAIAAGGRVEKERGHGKGSHLRE